MEVKNKVSQTDPDSKAIRYMLFTFLAKNHGFRCAGCSFSKIDWDKIFTNTVNGDASWTLFDAEVDLSALSANEIPSSVRVKIDWNREQLLDPTIIHSGGITIGTEAWYKWEFEKWDPDGQDNFISLALYVPENYATPFEEIFFYPKCP